MPETPPEPPGTAGPARETPAEGPREPPPGGTIGRMFMEKTCYAHLGPSAQSRGEVQPPVELEPRGAGAPLRLPRASSILTEGLGELVERRRSLRRYAAASLSLEELAALLWCTQGVEKTVATSATFRTVPSAGARHALETYLLINRVQGLEPGLYWYSALGHALRALPAGPGLAERLAAACLGQEQVRAGAVTFLWTAVVARMRWRYGERGYRYLHLDAGHVCQNLYLAAEALGCGACAVAAFDDEALNALLGLDGVEQFVIYLAAVGKR